MTCKVCGVKLHPRNQIGYCIRCAAERVCAEPECEQKLCRRTKGEYCASHSAQRLANQMWADPARRAEIVAQRAASARTAEGRAQLQAAAHAAWTGESGERLRQARMSENRRRMADPEYRASHVSRLNALWADPEFRAKHASGAETRQINGERPFMRGLDDEALMVFCAARDDGLTMWAARQDALMDMQERGVPVPRGPLVISRVPRGERLRVEVAA